MNIFLKKLLSKPVVARWIIDRALIVHNTSYKIASHFSVFLEEDNIHPKHRLMKYHDFFLERINGKDIVFDVGCGNAALACDIAKKASKVIGIDNNPSHLSHAKFLAKEQRNLTLIFGDATVYEFDVMPSVIVLSNILEHIHDRITFLRRLTSLCNRFLIRVPAVDRDWITLYKQERGIEWRLDLTHCTEYTLKSFEAELEEVNLKIIDYSIQFGEIWAECKLK